MSAHTLSWTNPTAYTDGTAYDQSQNAGYTLEIDSTPSVSVPLAWGTSFDLSTLSIWSTLKQGSHSVALAAVSKGGVQSDFSNPATFQIELAPNPPTALRVS